VWATVDCLFPFLGYFWGTQKYIDPAICDTGEPDYSPDSDSLLTSPPIDLGGPNNRLVSLGWYHVNTPSVPAGDGFVEVLIDHDDDGVVTPLAQVSGSIADFSSVDIQSNPLGAPILPADTAQFVRVQLRFRAVAPDPGATWNTEGWVVDDFVLVWEPCDQIPCAAGFRGSPAAGGTSRLPVGHAGGTSEVTGATAGVHSASVAAVAEP